MSNLREPISPIRNTRYMVVAIALMATILAASGALSLANRAGAATGPTLLTEYPIPTANSNPINIISTGASKLWFTMADADAIGYLEVKSDGSYQFKKYNTPTPNSEPFDLASDGTFIWFTERQANRIGKLTIANGNITEYVIPTANSEPSGIAVAPNGDVWFVQRASNQLARLRPATGAITEYPFVLTDALLEDIAVASNDSIWVTAPGRNSTANFKPSRGEFEIVPVLDFGLPPWQPAQIAVGSDDIPWITAPTKDLVGRFAPGTLGYWRWYLLRNEGAGVNGLFLERPQTMYRAWFTETDGNRAGFLLTSRATGVVLSLFEQRLPGNNPRPMGITVDSDGYAWIAAPGTNAIVSWRPPYNYRVVMPAVRAP